MGSDGHVTGKVGEEERYCARIHADAEVPQEPGDQGRGDYRSFQPLIESATQAQYLVAQVECHARVGDGGRETQIERQHIARHLASGGDRKIQVPGTRIGTAIQRIQQLDQSAEVAIGPSQPGRQGLCEGLVEDGADIEKIADRLFTQQSQWLAEPIKRLEL